MFTGTSEDAKKTSKKRKRRQVVPAVLYIDQDYWDARMTDVD